MALDTSGHWDSTKLDELGRSLAICHCESCPTTSKEACDEVDINMAACSLSKGAPRQPRAMEDDTPRLSHAASVGHTAFACDAKTITPTGIKGHSACTKHLVCPERTWEAKYERPHTYWTPGEQHDRMAEYDRRPHSDRRGYGGRRRYHGGGAGGRKRNFREYEADDEHRADNQRRREEPPTIRVRRNIIDIADSAMRDAKEDARDLATMIKNDWEDSYFQDHIQSVLLSTTLEQPLKIPHIAGIVLNLNTKDAEIVDKVLLVFQDRTQRAIEAGEWRTLKLLLRFFACTHGLFEGAAIISILDELFTRAIDLQAASSEDAIGLEITKIILLTIPYVLSAPLSDVDQLQKQTAELLNKTEVIAFAPPAAEDMITPYISIEGEEALTTEPVLKLLQTQLRREQANQWKLEYIPKIFEDPSEGDLIAGMSPAFKKHPFPGVQIPTTINPGPQPLFSEIYFSLYADQDVETVPRTANLAASVIRDTILDTINILDFNRGRTAKYLVELDCYWPKNTFTTRAAQFDRLRDAEPGTLTWKVEDLAVDAIFSQIMKLPCPEHKPVYYHSIITEMCTFAPSSIAPSLGRAIRFLYRHLNVMDLELTYRYMDWFSHHLSNFDFRWKWVEWQDDANLSAMHCRKAFVLGLLDKEVRLSFAKRIRDSLPEAFAVCIPDSRQNDIPEWKYRAETAPFHAEARQLVDCIRAKKPDEDIDPILGAIMNQASQDFTQPAPQLLAIDAFVTTLVYVGSKSLSHALSFIERHKDRLFAFSQEPLLPPNADASPANVDAISAANRVQIIASVVAYWRATNTGVAVSLVDKLLNYGVILPSSVVDWALGVTNPSSFRAGRPLCESWLYEIVSGTLGKVTGRIRQIVAARGELGIPKAEAEQLEETLTAEVQSMRTLFKTVQDVLVGVAEGSNNEMIEEGTADSVGEGSDELDISARDSLTLLKIWGEKWMRVFRRKAAHAEKAIHEGMSRWPEPVELPASAEDQANGVDNMDTTEADGV